MQALTAVLLLLAIAAPVVDWSVAFILCRAALKSPIRALRERALLAVGAAICTTLFLTNVINTFAGRPLWASDESRLVSWGIIIVFGILPVYWLVLYLTGRFRDKE